MVVTFLACLRQILSGVSAMAFRYYESYMYMKMRGFQSQITLIPLLSLLIWINGTVGSWSPSGAAHDVNEEPGVRRRPQPGSHMTIPSAMTVAEKSAASLLRRAASGDSGKPTMCLEIAAQTGAGEASTVT